MIRSAIRQRPLAVACATVLTVYAVPYVFPALIDGRFRLMAEVLAEPPLLILVLLASLNRRRRTAREESARFWGYIALSTGFWLLSDALALPWVFGKTFWIELAGDSLDLMSYWMGFMALEQHPHLESGWRERGWSYRFSIAGSLLFFLGFVLYFFSLPAVFEQRSYSSTIPLVILMFAFDLVFLVRFAHLAWTCRERHWRFVYGTFAVAATFWTVGDGITWADFAGYHSVPFGTPADFIWWLPALALVLAAERPEPSVATRHALGQRPDDGFVTAQRRRAPDFLLLQACLFPVVHLAFSALALLAPPFPRVREWLVLCVLALFLGLAAYRQRVLESQAADLRSTISVMVSHEELQQAQRMEAIGRLAGGIAHDFNNLLTIIRGYVDLVTTRGNLDARSNEELDRIRQAGSRAAGLVQQLLAFSRKQVLTPTVLDVNSVVEEARSMLGRTLGEGIRLETRLGADLPRIEADRGQLFQVILNLAVNARDAMPEGGRLRIATAAQHVAVDDSWRASDAAPGRYVTVSVRDSGQGMDDETRARIFEPFFSRKPQGTGLGLATVYGIVRQSGGFIQVESAPASGSEFRIFLPATDRAAEPAPAPVAANAARPTAETGVLLVEDQAPVRETVRDMLEALDLIVYEAEGLEDAIEQASLRSGRIDLLLTDIVLPGTSGWEIAGRVVESCPGVRVVYMSGYVEESRRPAAEAAPIGPLLEKPFTLDKLRSTLGEAMSDRTDR